MTGAPGAAPTGSAGSGTTFLLLGATGDLTERWLLPGLGGLIASGGVEDLFLLGSGTQDWSDERWQKRVADSFAAAGATGSRLTAVVEAARYVQADVTAPADLRRLLDGCRGELVVFFALPPAVTMRACRVLRDVGVPAGARLVLEKPFGTDAASAEELNEVLQQLVPEDRVHRVDHYLGMSTVLNIIGLRFANRFIESCLNGTSVAEVEIVFDESLALEGRAGYYDGSGALVDMIQSHSLQVLSLLAMEPPSTLDARDVRDSKAQLLRATRVWEDDPVRFSRRARYSAGEVEGRRLPAYADEPGVDPARGTETFAEVVLAVDTWRWAGVPFRLRTGKALRATRKEAVITLKPPPWVPAGLRGFEQPDRLRIGFDPDRLDLDLNINGPADPAVLDRTTLGVAAAGAGALSPYGQVLQRVFDDDPTLSVRADTVVDCWRIVEPVLEAWRSGKVPLEEYPAGSSGP